MCWNVGNVSAANGCVWTLASFVFWAKLRVQKQKHITPHHPIYYKQQQKNKTNNCLPLLCEHFVWISFEQLSNWNLQNSFKTWRQGRGRNRVHVVNAGCSLLNCWCKQQATIKFTFYHFTFHLVGGPKWRRPGRQKILEISSSNPHSVLSTSTPAR